MSAILGQLGAGQTIEQLLAGYPYLEHDDILAALRYASAVMLEHELPFALPA